MDLNGDFEWVCSTITSQNIYGRTPMILLTMRPSRLFVKIRCHAVASTRKRSAVSDRGLPCHEFEPSATKDPPCRAAMHVKSVESRNVLPLMWCDRRGGCQLRCRPRHLNRAINRHLVLEDWFSKWKIALNVAKTEAVFTRKKRLIYPDIFLHNEKIPWSQNTKYLGVTLDNKLTFKQRIRENFIKKAHTLSHLISRRSKLSRSNKLLIYSSLLRPIITYASPVWSFAAKTHIQKLEVLQNKTLRQILRADCETFLRSRVNEKIAPFCVTEKKRTEVVFPSPRIVAMSECLNQIHKEEKNFVKKKLAEIPVEKVTKKQKNSANSSSATAKSPSEYT
ncbi:RNA-directed DNA polymerase from mobile element jockey [Trichonephila clavipes]|nr:RNA-directed DNA polymerase from mobile element jockey [Trichonephila clavipes]